MPLCEPQLGAVLPGTYPAARMSQGQARTAALRGGSRGAPPPPAAARAALPAGRCRPRAHASSLPSASEAPTAAAALRRPPPPRCTPAGAAASRAAACVRGAHTHTPRRPTPPRSPAPFPGLRSQEGAERDDAGLRPPTRKNVAPA